MGNRLSTLKVSYLFRRRAKVFSVERLFSDLIRALPEEVSASRRQVPFERSTLFGIVGNILYTGWTSRKVTHITGDIHYCALGLIGRKCVLTVLDLGILKQSTGLKRRLYRLLWFTLPLRFCSRIICISDSTRRELLAECPRLDPARVVTFHVPINPRFERREKAFCESCPRILHFNMKPNKNLDRSIEALDGIPCHLRIIGSLTDRQKELLEQYKISFSCVNNISDEQILEEYRASDMLCFPSTYEGFGMPIAEAQATGRPVVTSGILSMPEVGGDAACYVDPFSTESIRAGIQKLISDRNFREDLIERGCENAKRFQVENIVKLHVDLYRSLSDE